MASSMLLACRASAKPAFASMVRTTTSLLPHLLVSSGFQPRAASTLAVATQLTSGPCRSHLHLSRSMLTRQFADDANSPLYSTVHHPVSTDSDDERFAIVALGKQEA